MLLYYSTGYIFWIPLGSYSPKYEDITLNKVVGDLVLRWDEFLTVLTTAEVTLNSRLLALVESTSDGIEPLTHTFLLEDHYMPFPLCLMNIQRSLPSGGGTSLKDSSESWRRWRDECFTQLQCWTKWKTLVRDIQIGDTVLLKDEDSFQHS